MSALPQGFDHACFVSFSQRDRDADGKELAHFLERLHARFSANAKLNENGESYYLLNEHAASANFRDLLKRAMPRCVCSLSLYSPNYWASEECALERSVFLDRNLSGKLPGDVPRGLDCFAVPWRLQPSDNLANSSARVVPADITDHIRELSYFRAESDCPSIYREGLQAVIQRDDADSRLEVERYIVELADSMCKVIERFRLGLVPRTPMRRGYLYVLASGPLDIQDKLLSYRDETRANRVSEAYMVSGGPDWHPFTPGDPNRSIGRIVGDIVKNEMGGQICELVNQLDMTTTLHSAVARAADRQEYAIVVIDPLSVHHFDGMRYILGDFDRGNYKYRNLLLVIVRSADETSEEKANFDDMIDKLFPHFIDDTEWFFIDRVDTEKDFTARLKSNFVKLRSKMQTSPRRRVDVSGPLSPAVL